MTKGTPASSQIIWLEQRVKELEAERDALAKELEGEHSPAELRQMLDESFAEKKKAYFALEQHQKAIKNLIAERDTLRAELTKPKQKPVAWRYKHRGTETVYLPYRNLGALYTEETPLFTKDPDA
jgi:chromosome segregation ATPase